MNDPVCFSQTPPVDDAARFVRSVFFGSVICLLSMTGCEQESIHTYIAPKAEPVMAEPRGMTRPMGMGGGEMKDPTRMLGAILRQPDETWFFKLTGPPNEAAALREEFGKFVASTQFENGEPSWEIPAGWIEERGRAMRFTTYHIGQDGPEVSISTLPNNVSETEAAVSNINRWRRQLGLAQLDSQTYLKTLETDKDSQDLLPEEEGEIVSISTPAGQAILIDFVNEVSQSAPAPQADAGIPKLNPPDHWTPGKLNPFRVAAFVVADGDETADVTLSSAGGELLPNINRWRTQVDLPAWTSNELAKEKQTLAGQGYKAEYVKLVGPTSAILGAVINQGGKQWFVKLTGPKALAEKEMQNFESFVKAIEF